MGPAAAGQLRRLNAAVPEMLARFTARASLFQQGTSIASLVERADRAVTAAAQDAGWLLMVPVIAIFFLTSRAALLEGTVDLFARRQDRATVKRTVDQIDSMLAQYMRAQLVLAGLSSAFYSASMAILGFPYPLALGVMGGALEFLPVVGWVLAAAAILVSGWLTDAHWIWMGGLIVIWRVVQNLVTSPRIMGDRLQMEPITVIFALMAGGQIGGLLGVVLSVPAVAVLRILWLERSSRHNAAAA